MFDQATGEATNMRKRVAGIPVLYDLDARFRVMERFGDDYRQILTIASPPIETLGQPAVSRDLARLANDELAGLCPSTPTPSPASPPPPRSTTPPPPSP